MVHFVRNFLVTNLRCETGPVVERYSKGIFRWGKAGIRNVKMQIDITNSILLVFCFTLQFWATGENTIVIISHLKGHSNK